MDPQVIIGTNTRRSDMIASMERRGHDHKMLDLGSNLALYLVYDYLPGPPVSPTATLALSGASWVPDGVDRISRLPDSLLSDIVSRLPAKDAARTAAFASRWRPVWRSAPLTVVDSHLLPDCGAEGPYTIGAPSPRAVTAAVSRVLAAHPGPFRCVHLTRTTMDEHRGEMTRWLDVLVAKGVQELIFVNRPWPVDLRLPATLFSCATLTRLYLGIWRLPDTAAVPRGAAFPNLRELGLCFNVMQDCDIDFMLQRSPVLEILIIMGSQTGVRLRLISQSLRLAMHPTCACWDTFSRESKRWRLATPSSWLGPKITLSRVFRFWSRLPVFLRCFPNLDTLHVQSEKDDGPTGKVNLKFWQEGVPIRCVVQTMKKVFFYEFHGTKSEVAFLKFIAERARVLEKMVIVVASECFASGDNVTVKLKPLTSAKWNSKACKLELFKSPRADVGSPVFSHQLESDFRFADPFDLIYYQESLLRSS
ncbi:unnamed protein product [Alopecurus aequalis]